MTSTSKSLEPFDAEGKPATADGRNIALCLVAAILAGGNKRDELNRLHSSGQITDAQHAFFTERFDRRAA